MRHTLGPLLLLCAARAVAADITEENFRKNLHLGPEVRMAYRDLDCQPVSFDGFAAAMHAEGAHADLDRSPDGKSITMTVRLRGANACPSPYPPITEMPPLDLPDLDGKRVTNATFKGKVTLVNFFFSTCLPCLLEVQPLNHFAAQRPGMNFVAITFDEPEVARRFAAKFGFKWRIVPGARDFIDRVRVKQYPMMALFDAKGRLLGTRKGGARDELEAANVEPQLKRWIDGLLKR